MKYKTHIVVLQNNGHVGYRILQKRYAMLYLWSHGYSTQSQASVECDFKSLDISVPNNILFIVQLIKTVIFI